MLATGLYQALSMLEKFTQITGLVSWCVMEGIDALHVWEEVFPPIGPTVRWFWGPCTVSI